MKKLNYTFAWFFTCVSLGTFLTITGIGVGWQYFLVMLPVVFGLSVNRTLKLNANLPAIITFIYMTIMLDIFTDVSILNPVFYLSLTIFGFAYLDKYLTERKMKRNEN